MPVYQNLILGMVDVALSTVILLYIYGKTQTRDKYITFIICLLIYEWSIRLLFGYEFILYTINIVVIVLTYYSFEKNISKSLGMNFFIVITGMIQEIITMTILISIKGSDYVLSNIELYNFRFLVIINFMGIAQYCILIIFVDISKLLMRLKNEYEFPLSIIGLNCLCIMSIARTINFLEGNNHIYVFLVFYIIFNIYIIISYNKLDKLNNSIRTNRIVSDAILTDIENIRRVQMKHKDKLKNYGEYNEVVMLENEMLSVYLSGVLMNSKYKGVKFNIDRDLRIDDDSLDEFILALDMILNEKICTNIDIGMNNKNIVINFDDMEFRSIMRCFISMPSSMKIRKNYIEMKC